MTIVTGLIWKCYEISEIHKYVVGNDMCVFTYAEILVKIGIFTISYSSFLYILTHILNFNCFYGVLFILFQTLKVFNTYKFKIPGNKEQFGAILRSCSLLSSSTNYKNIR